MRFLLLMMALGAVLAGGGPLSAQVVDVLKSGASGAGCPHDDAPALRAIFAAARPGQTILFPAGYDFCLGSTVPPLDYPATDPVALLIAGKQDLRIEAQGARLVVAPQIAFSSAVLIAQGKRIRWHGGAIVGSRSGLRADQENVGISLVNLVDFRVEQVHFSGFADLGAAVAGDLLVRGTLANLRMEGVGLCFDLAFLRNIVVRDVVARGAGAADGVGQTCFSSSVDRIFQKFNRVGAAFADSANIRVEKLDASNFTTGIAITSGRGWRFADVTLKGLRGRAGVPALGYYLHRNAGGGARGFGTQGTRIDDVAINGGSVSELDGPAGGYGVLIEEDGTAGGVGSVAISGVSFSDLRGEAVASKGGFQRKGLRLSRNRIAARQSPQSAATTP